MKKNKQHLNIFVAQCSTYVGHTDLELLHALRLVKLETVSIWKTTKWKPITENGRK